MLDDTVAGGAKVEVGGGRDPGERYIAPTVLTGVSADSAVMANLVRNSVIVSGAAIVS